MATPQEPGPPPTGTPPTRAERPRRATGPRNTEVADLLAGTLLGKYRIGRRLGSGGMGVVYQATHVEIGKDVALKVLNADLAEGTRARARFLREAAAAAKIDHPNVVRVTDYGAEGAVPYIVMELLRGEDLSGLLRRHRRGLPVTEAANILLAVCAAVFTAHQARVIHRDLKPRNIFLARTRLFEMGPKILDFGISKLEDEDGVPSLSLTDPGYLLGTPHYLSPEQVAGHPADARSDQYALGVVLFECLTGQRPHEGHQTAEVLARICKGAVPPPRRLRPDLPAALEVVVLRAIALTPEARFRSVHALGAALLPFASSKQQVAWSDYYLGDRAPEPPSETAPADTPESPEAPPTSGTVFLPEPSGPVDESPPPDGQGATATLTRLRPETPQPEPELAPEHPRRGPLPGLLLLLAVGGGTFAGATYLMQHWPLQTRQRAFPSATAPKTTESPTPSPASVPAADPLPRTDPPTATTPPPTPAATAEPAPATTPPPTVPASAESDPVAARAAKAPSRLAPAPALRRPADRSHATRRLDRRAASTPPPAIRRNAVQVPVPIPLRLPPLPPEPAAPRSEDGSPSPAPILH